jgi:hypothetical protein
MHLTLRTCLVAFFSIVSIRAHADAPAQQDAPGRADSAASEPARSAEQVPPLSSLEIEPREYERTPAFEVNVLWPFFPGGLVDLKALVPIVRTDRPNFQGELIAGLHSDFSWGPVSRPVDKYGKVSILAAKVGYRQFFVAGLHVEISVNVGWRHEEKNIHDGGRLDAFIGRSWWFAGYQHEFSRKMYANIRGGGGLHLFRTDRFGDTERVFVPAGDVNLGVRF